MAEKEHGRSHRIAIFEYSNARSNTNRISLILLLLLDAQKVYEMLKQTGLGHLVFPRLLQKNMAG